MGVLRRAATAILMLATAVLAEGQCASEVRTISTRRSVPNLVAGPVAWGNGVLAVTKFDRVARRIFLATYDHDFNQLSGDTLVSDATPDGPLHLIWNGAGFGLFYRTASPQRLVLQRIATAGHAIGAPIPVSSRTIDVTEEIDVVWSNALNAYAMATTFEPGSAKDVWITVMDRDGIVRRDLPTNVFAAKDLTYINVAVTDDAVIGVFYRAEADESILFARVGAGPGAPVDQIWSPGHDLLAAARGDRFYLAKRVVVSGRSEVRWLVLDSAGSVAGPDRLLLRGHDIDVRPISLIVNGGELALTYVDSALGFENDAGELRLFRFTPAGEMISDSLFAIGDPVHRYSLAGDDPAWTGRAYITSAVYEFGRELDSQLIRLCPLRASISTPRLVITNDDTVTFTALAEGGAPGYRYLWDMGDRSTPRTGQTVRHRFIHTGTYNVVVTVTDEAGVVTTATVQVVVTRLKTRAVRK